MKWWVFFLPLALYGLYCGNPDAPELPEKGFFLPLKAPVSLRIGYQGDYVFKTGKDLKYQMQQAVLTIDWIDRVDLFFSLGEMKQSSHRGFTWGVGSEVLLLYWNQFLMGVNAKFQMAPHGYREWQVAPAVGYEWKMARPYLGVAYHSIDLESKFVKRANHHPFILFFGLGVAPEKGIAINLEGRAIGETAFSLSINFRL